MQQTKRPPLQKALRFSAVLQDGRKIQITAFHRRLKQPKILKLWGLPARWSPRDIVLVYITGISTEIAVCHPDDIFNFRYGFREALRKFGFFTTDYWQIVKAFNAAWNKRELREAEKKLKLCQKEFLEFVRRYPSSRQLAWAKWHSIYHKLIQKP